MKHLIAACLAAFALLGASATARPAATPRVVSVADFHFGPSAVAIRAGGTVKWVWSSANAYPHDVHLRQGPKGLKRKGTYSAKATAVTDARFKKAFPTPGSYKYVCTIHPTEMKLTVTVRR